MPAKKAAEEAAEEAAVVTANFSVTEKAEKKLSPWDTNETIMVPLGGKDEENFIIVSVNGRRFQIQRGVQVEVPKPVAEVYRNSIAMQYTAREYDNQAAQKADKLTDM